MIEAVRVVRRGQYKIRLTAWRRFVFFIIPPLALRRALIFFFPFSCGNVFSGNGFVYGCFQLQQFAFVKTFGGVPFTVFAIYFLHHEVFPGGAVRAFVFPHSDFGGADLIGSRGFLFGGRFGGGGLLCNGGDCASCNEEGNEHQLFPEFHGESFFSLNASKI